MAQTPEAPSADALLADRVQSARALGGNREFCMHAGVNTSIKVLRDGRPVLHVKGSGWDLTTFEAEVMPGLWLEPLGSVRAGARLADSEIVRFLRANLLDPAAPNPSVETLLHAYLPARFVDHGHASAVLAIANQPEPRQREIVERIFGDRIAFLPYVFPGFDLSIAGARLADSRPKAEGMWLTHHGLFTWGDSAEQSLGGFRQVVRECETWLSGAGAALMPPSARESSALLDAVAGRLAALFSGQGPFRERCCVDPRGASALARLSTEPGLAEAVSRGTVTPDHVIRIKPWPLVLSIDDTQAGLRAALERFMLSHRTYFDENVARSDHPLTMLDTLPRVALVPCAGLIGLGRTEKEAAIHADLTEQNLRVVAAAEALATYTPIPRHEQFRIEYWELEQAKLKPA